MSSSELQDWNEMSLGERIVRAAWMAAREHLAQVEGERQGDQASELRRLVLAERLRRLGDTGDREAA